MMALFTGVTSCITTRSLAINKGITKNTGPNARNCTYSVIDFNQTPKLIDHLPSLYFFMLADKNAWVLLKTDYSFTY